MILFWKNVADHLSPKVHLNKKLQADLPLDRVYAAWVGGKLFMTKYAHYSSQYTVLPVLLIPINLRIIYTKSPQADLNRHRQIQSLEC